MTTNSKSFQTMHASSIRMDDYVGASNSPWQLSCPLHLPSRNPGVLARTADRQEGGTTLPHHVPLVPPGDSRTIPTARGPRVCKLPVSEICRRLWYIQHSENKPLSYLSSPGKMKAQLRTLKRSPSQVPAPHSTLFQSCNRSRLHLSNCHLRFQSLYLYTINIITRA